jgi:hypothetical protein
MKRNVPWLLIAVGVGCGGSDPDATDLSAMGGSAAGALSNGESAAGVDRARVDSPDGGSPAGGGGTRSSQVSAGGATGTGGGAGTHGSRGGEGGSGQDGAVGPCAVPDGDAVANREYAPPATALGCDFDAPLVSATLVTEAEFLTAFSCPQSSASGVDFAVERLQVTVIREAGFIAPTRRQAVRSNATVRLGFVLPRYCGGAFPPRAVLLTVLPSGSEPVEEDVCRPGDCGAGGFPP